MRFKVLEQFYVKLVGYLTVDKLHETYDEELGKERFPEYNDINFKVKA